MAADGASRKGMGFRSAVVHQDDGKLEMSNVVFEASGLLVLGLAERDGFSLSKWDFEGR